MEPDDDPGFPGDPARVRRAKALGALSLVVVAVACVAYLRPSIQPVPSVPTLPTSYQLDAVDFVNPSTGWVLADLDTSAFAVVSTKDAGRSWTTRLVSPSSRHGEYMRFFDRSAGVVVAIGAEAAVFATRDGGAHWTRKGVNAGDVYVMSASFVDPMHGWLLGFGAVSTGLGSTVLLRTTDGGASWKDLGPAAVPSVQAFAVSFTDQRNGWLDAVAPGPYAYTTSDAGATWRQVTLPTPATGWPVPNGSFFVAARPTLGNGVVATVVNSLHINGRFGGGTAVVTYPPLTVRTYDGGSPVTYVYSTFVDGASDGILHINDALHKPGPATQVQAASQIGMRSTDGGQSWTPFVSPAPGGTIGYADAMSWWWIGPGLRSKTADGGLTWSPSQADAVADPLPGSLVVLDSRYAWVSGVSDSGQLLFTTADGGEHWTAVRLPQAFT
jgi:photosystem II stability/assembly factor-like uncharacterized protein